MKLFILPIRQGLRPENRHTFIAASKHKLKTVKRYALNEYWSNKLQLHIIFIAPSKIFAIRLGVFFDKMHYLLGIWVKKMPWFRFRYELYRDVLKEPIRMFPERHHSGSTDENKWPGASVDTFFIIFRRTEAGKIKKCQKQLVQ